MFFPSFRKENVSNKTWNQILIKTQIFRVKNHSNNENSVLSLSFSLRFATNATNITRWKHQVTLHRTDVYIFTRIRLSYFVETISQSRANDTIFRIFIAPLLLGGHPRGYRSRKSRDSLTQRQRIAKIRFPARYDKSILAVFQSLVPPRKPLHRKKKEKGKKKKKENERFTISS